MGIASAWGFELTKFFGQQGLDFVLIEAEMKGLGDELVQCRTELLAARIDLQRRRLVRDESAEAPARFDKALALQDLIDLHDGEGIDLHLRRKLADGRELLPVVQLAGEDALLELLLQLHVKGDAALGVKEKHGVVVQ